jgi:hypothetical protein
LELRLIEVETVEVIPLRMIVTPTVRSTRDWNFLSADWCDCAEGGSFLCYVEENCCDCGVDRHHTHCKECGGVRQVG